MAYDWIVRPLAERVIKSIVGAQKPGYKPQGGDEKEEATGGDTILCFPAEARFRNYKVRSKSILIALEDAALAIYVIQRGKKKKRKEACVRTHTEREKIARYRGTIKSNRSVIVNKIAIG